MMSQKLTLYVLISCLIVSTHLSAQQSDSRIEYFHSKYGTAIVHNKPDMSCQLTIVTKNKIDTVFINEKSVYKHIVNVELYEDKCIITACDETSWYLLVFLKSGKIWIYMDSMILSYQLYPGIKLVNKGEDLVQVYQHYNGMRLVREVYIDYKRNKFEIKEVNREKFRELNRN